MLVGQDNQGMSVPITAVACDNEDNSTSGDEVSRALTFFGSQVHFIVSQDLFLIHYLGGTHLDPLPSEGNAYHASMWSKFS